MSWHYNLYKQKAKTNICNWADIIIIAALKFVIKKTKIIKNILNQKAFAACILIIDITAFVLQFLKTKKQKKIYTTSLTHLQLISFIIIFINKKA